MNMGESFSAGQALEEIERMRGKVRRSSRWVGWLYLFWGVSAVVYWSLMFLGGSTVRMAAAIAWLVLTAGSFVFIHRQRVHGSGMDRLQYVITFTWLGTMVGAALAGSYVLPDEPTGWWVVAAVAVAGAAAVPVLYGAWRLRPWAGER
ncbi:hypothetical protein GCM10009677_47990 [Sphaerisporangium rubeum]|uniref:Uncharacterized protein n=1 Tax=Sphaerisporangium rubeum TaxID=321317 RepID=A0A7X0M9Q6_9ACTN|nr:hypothetical protein [Sphaerisporangium rubeum]MBB6475294.1 hypothetical protein [Sphaerisporangium rubeum]